MTETPHAQAMSYIRGCAEKIAPYWSKHYETAVPPKEVLDFFDKGIANLTHAMPNLAVSFGLPSGNKHQLESELLDLMIKEAQLAVETLRAQEERSRLDDEIISADEKIMRLENEKEERFAAELEADVSDLDAQIEAETETLRRLEAAKTKADRLAYLRSKRKAKQEAEEQEAEQQEAERRETERLKNIASEQSKETFFEKVHAALNRTSDLVNEQGTILPGALDEIVLTFAGKTADRWAAHGGSTLHWSLSGPLLRVAQALHQGVDARDGTWDFKMDDGTIARPESTEWWIGVIHDWLERLVVELAEPDFTYELENPWSMTEIESLLLETINENIDVLEFLRAHEAELASAAESLIEWQQHFYAPEPAPYGVSPAGAEEWCKDWLEHMGLQDAEVTQLTGDGGIDITSPTYVAQVKHYAGSVSIAEIRELAGVAAVEGKLPIFMTSGRYPAQAEGFADKAGMLLYRYDVATGEVEGCTEESRNKAITGFLVQN